MKESVDWLQCKLRGWTCLALEESESIVRNIKELLFKG